jgi:F-type H+-transporting ATPase subunit a
VVTKRARWLIIAILGLLIVADVVSPLRVSRITVEIRPETLFMAGPLPITNTLLTSWLTMVVLVIVALPLRRKLVDAPKAHSLQNVVETALEALRGFMQNFGHERTDAFFPVVCTFFLFILTSNWLGLLPGIGSIGYWQSGGGQVAFVPLLRGPTTDLNTTIALAICAVASSQIYGIHFLGLGRFLGRYLPIHRFATFFRALRSQQHADVGLLFGGMLDLFIGALEVFEELTKILSFSFRLFGNVFGGEVLLAVMGFLMPYLASVPFLALELFGGFIQAVIFAALSTAFLARATTPHNLSHPNSAEAPLDEPASA